jgi:hypothetical protein
VDATKDLWYVSHVADIPTLRMLLNDIRDHVRRARLCKGLDPDAQVFAVTEPDFVKLWMNAAALLCIDVFHRVPLEPAQSPANCEQVNSLIAWGSRVTGQQIAVR